jgi:CPA2 family monovalent cation:H+ antiporter-2
MSRVREGEIVVKKSNHVTIVGLGSNGRNLARVLKDSDIPYVVLELNPDAVRKSKRKGEPIYYGDGTSPEMLRKLGILWARVLVIAISDPSATRRIVEIARMENPRIHIMVRTRYVSEIEELVSLGADEVRKEGYRTLRTDLTAKTRVGMACLMVEGLEMDSYLVDERSWLIGKSIRDVNLRANTGATIVAIKREDSNILNPEPDFILRENDVVTYIGSSEQIVSTFHFLRGRCGARSSGQEV